MGWIRTHWLKVTGYIVLGDVLLQTSRAIYRTIRTGGDIDFLIERSKDPGWIQLMIDHIINPSPVTILLLLLVGLALIWWDTTRHSKAHVTVAAPIESQLRHEDRLQDKQDLRRLQLEAARMAMIPNWPIHELFLHIDPTMLERANEQPDPWEIVGGQILDALAIGRLRSWGRPMNDFAASQLEQRPVLREINRDYWQSATFSYWFFDDSTRGKEHTYVPAHSDLPRYTDLQVNRAEALAIWPAAQS